MHRLVRDDRGVEYISVGGLHLEDRALTSRTPLQRP